MVSQLWPAARALRSSVATPTVPSYGADVDGAGYRELLRPLIEGRRVILAGGVATDWTSTVSLVRSLGAIDVLVIGTGGMGAGPLPDPADATVLALPSPRAASMMEAIYAGLARLHAPPPQVLDAVRRFDPAGAALVLTDFLGTAAELDGRPFLAYRRPEWVALEDKTLVDDLWERLGVEHAPSMVVPARRPELLGAARRVGGAAGSVWSGDTKEGFNGGAEFIRWIRTASHAEEAARYFAAHCDRVRVMPFLDGVPCSIHGMVFPDHVAASRPVEMVTLQHREDSGAHAFFYAGCASFYDPPTATRDRMRAIAYRVGAALRAEVNFRGAFTVDGVVDGETFLPTELNPRLGAGLNVLSRGLPDLPIELLMAALVGGVDLGYDPAQFETDLVAAADSHRFGGTWRVVPGTRTDSRIDVPLAYTDRTWHWAAGGEPVAGTLTTGPAAFGVFARCAFQADQTPIGTSVGPRAASFWAFADRELGTRIGPLTAATSLT